MQGFDDIQRLFGDDVLDAACAAYGCTRSDATRLGAFENYVFELPGARILRIGHERRRPAAWINAEVEWIHDLTEHGVSAAPPIRNGAGDWVTTLPNGFLAAGFGKVSGRRASRADYAEPFLRRWGHMLAHMHDLSIGYAPPSAHRRPKWDDPLLSDVHASLESASDGVGERFRELKATLDSLPTPPDAYGLIHQDFHGGNFLIGEDDTIHLFDFDDAAYAWFAADIGIALFYMCINADDADLPARVVRWLGKGYAERRRLSPEWARAIPRFLELREIELYEVIRTRVSPNPDPTSWVGRFMAGRRGRIEEGLPALPIHPDTFEAAFGD